MAEEAGQSPDAQSGKKIIFHGIPIEREDPEELFEILRLLGKGTFGHAYMARNTLTGEIVAAKQIPLVNDEEIEVVRREVRILSMCDHHNVVRYKGTYRGVNALWITMEYCAGGSVDTIYNILKRPLPEHLIAFVCREVLLGLVYLHSMKKIHRDIKGANVLLTQDGEVKLADFGVSTELMHSMSRRNSFIGTLYWMAPETILEKEYDERADIWSLGITLIEIAEGQPPRRDLHYTLALFAIPSQPPPQLRRKDAWSPLMHKFLARLLVKEPQHRPTAEQLLSDPFLQPASLGPDPRGQLQIIIEAAQTRAAGMTTARRLGEESSGSDATVRERSASSGASSSNSSERSSAQSSGDAASSGASSAGSVVVKGSPGNSLPRKPPKGRRKKGAAKQHGRQIRTAEEQEEDLIARCVEEGLLVPLPPVSTDELDLDELCPGGGPVAPLSAVESDADILTAVYGSTSGASPSLSELPPELQPRLPSHLTHATRQLLASYTHYRTTIYTATQLGPDEEERARALASKYGTILKSTLRL